jgi:hypothetical protein
MFLIIWRLKNQPTSYENQDLHKLLNEFFSPRSDQYRLSLWSVQAELFRVLCVVAFLFGISFLCAKELVTTNTVEPVGGELQQGG